MTERSFRRYTNLASALHILRNCSLTLLSPDTWDDRNDTFFMSEYKRLKGVKTLLAICMAVREETYHHWQVFSRGADGVCIEFDREMLLQAFDRAGVAHRNVDYELISNVNTWCDVDLEVLPFTKRWPYGDEKEYRAVFTSTDQEISAFSIPIELPAIDRITLSPWLAPGLVDVVKETLRSIPGCTALDVYRSTLIDNKQWQKVVGRVVPPPSVPSS